MLLNLSEQKRACHTLYMALDLLIWSCGHISWPLSGCRAEVRCGHSYWQERGDDQEDPKRCRRENPVQARWVDGHKSARVEEARRVYESVCVVCV